MRTCCSARPSSACRSLHHLFGSKMKRIEYLAPGVLLLVSVFASACRGQDSQPKPVDPALVAVVDSIVPKLEVLSGLKKVKPITLAEQSREDLRKYVETRLAEEMPPAEMEGVRQTYVQLGLMSDTVNVK